MVCEAMRMINIFYCFAPKDQVLCDELDKHLSILRKRGWIRSWRPGMVQPGINWEREQEARLQTADIVLLLVSPDFVADEFCYRVMQKALNRQTSREVVVIPIILRPFDWTTTPLQGLRVLPTNGMPVTQWGNLDMAFFNIANGIQTVIKTLLKGIFISYAPEDRAFAIRLQRDLEERGIPVSSRHDENIRGMMGVENSVKQMIRASQMILLIASPHAPYAQTMKDELYIAVPYEQPIPVWAEGNEWQEVVPQELIECTPIDARGSSYDSALEKIVTLHGKIDVPPDHRDAGPEFKPRNPFKGLRAFTSNDVRDFFGREKLINSLVAAIRAIQAPRKNDSRDARLLAVIGPSGVGKSSVVQAGLLPKLQNGVIPGSEKWVYLRPLQPGEHPVETLGLYLSESLYGKSTRVVQEDLRDAGARGLYWCASKLAKLPGTRVVLFIDQFEELFTQTASEDERQHFINLLITAVTEPRSPLIVILTLRADFYDRPMRYPQLYQFIQDHQVSVLPMDIHDLRAVIEKPTSLPDVQLMFEGNLIGDLLFEVREQVGALPLLQFALDQLF